MLLRMLLRRLLLHLLRLLLSLRMCLRLALPVRLWLRRLRASRVSMWWLAWLPMRVSVLSNNGAGWQQARMLAKPCPDGVAGAVGLVVLCSKLALPQPAPDRQ